MKASEASQISSANANRIAREKAKEAAVAKVTRIKNEKAARKKFYQEHLQSAYSSIRYAVEAGRKETHLSWSDSYNYAYGDHGAQNGFDKHKHLRELKLIMKKLRQDGYTVKQEISSQTYTTQHESSVPDYDYTLFWPIIKITWK